MAYFTARTTANAAPEQVLQVLTDPEAIREWSPIPFEVDELDGLRLEAGSCARVSGCLAGKRVGFDVEVHAADAGRLELTAEGPISFDVLYRLDSVAGGSEVTASVRLRDGSGFTGRLLSKATGALLKGGALDAAAGRIARAAESTPCLVAA
jgi:uncharacterized protein YndB with AHSA1/START domain